MNITTYTNKIQNILHKDYDHEIPDKPRSIEFNRVIKSMLKAMFPECIIIPTKGAWCEASGFISNSQNNKVVYYSFQDYRYWDWKEKILIRTAKDATDYTGGANYFTDITRMQADVLRMIK